MSTYKDTIRLLVLTLVLGAPIAGAQNPDSPAGNSKSTQPAPQASGDDTKADAATLSSKDRKFIKKAAIGGIYEVQAGQLALKNASSEDVRLMAQQIVEDHSEANNKLKAIAQSKGVELPTQLDSKHQRKLDSLSKVTGAEFDRKYTSMMVSDHKKDIKAFEKEAADGSDPQLKAFASETAPKLRKHLAMAQSAKQAADRAPATAADTKTQGEQSSEGATKQ